MDSSFTCPHCNFRAYNAHHLEEHLEGCEQIYLPDLNTIGWVHEKRGDEHLESWRNFMNSPEADDAADVAEENWPGHQGKDIRRDKNGEKEDSFGQVGMYWEVFDSHQDNFPTTDQVVALKMALFKLARWQVTGQEDHLYDMVKYAEEAYNRNEEP